MESILIYIFLLIAIESLKKIFEIFQIFNHAVTFELSIIGYFIIRQKL